jgi:hypothetical protein
MRAAASSVLQSATKEEEIALLEKELEKIDELFEHEAIAKNPMGRNKTKRIFSSIDLSVHGKATLAFS